MKAARLKYAQWPEGGLEGVGQYMWREEEGHGRGYFWSQERRMYANGNVGHLPLQTRRNRTDPLAAQIPHPGAPDGNHLKFGD